MGEYRLDTLGTCYKEKHTIFYFFFLFFSFSVLIYKIEHFITETSPDVHHDGDLFSWCVQPKNPMNKSQIMLDDHFGTIIGYGKALIALMLGAVGKWLLEGN